MKHKKNLINGKQFHQELMQMLLIKKLLQFLLINWEILKKFGNNFC